MGIDINIRHEIRRLLWKLGYDISKLTPAAHSLARRKERLGRLAIDTVLDIGANVGQFARELRSDLGYRGKILSFEPLSSAYRALAGHAEDDPAWQAFKFGLGDGDETMEINVAGNSQSSSLLPMLRFRGSGIGADAAARWNFCSAAQAAADGTRS